MVVFPDAGEAMLLPFGRLPGWVGCRSVSR
jgi:hypothetical protein